jgi:hypothetical protein
LKVRGNALSKTQRNRLASMELRAFFTSELSGGDIENQFGDKAVTASLDLGIYREIAPRSLDNNSVGRRYRPMAALSPIFECHHESVLAWLLQGFGDGLELSHRLVIPCKWPGQWVRPNMADSGSGAALADYILRHWSSDASPDHRLDPSSHHR